MASIHKTTISPNEPITTAFLTNTFVHQSQILGSADPNSGDEDVMSQKAVKEALAIKANATDMTTGLAGKANTSGTYAGLNVGSATKASQDGNGSVIADTYFKASQVKTATGTSATDVMSQKATTDALAVKGIALGTKDGVSITLLDANNNKLSEVTPPYATAAGSASTAGTANRLFGGSVITGETVTSLENGKTYLNCAITASVSSGSYYLYNCTGTITLMSNSTARIYATNCPSPSLTINGITSTNWMNVFFDGIASKPCTDISTGIVRQYLDGTMIQSGTGNVAGNAPSKGLFTFPVSFIDANYTVTISSNLLYNNADYSWYRTIFAAGGYSKSQFAVTKISCDGNSQAAPWFCYTAIGRWK